MGVMLILAPFLFALSHLLIAVLLHHHSKQPAWENLRPLYALSGIAVTASAWGAWMIIGRTLSPIRQLAEQARSSRPEKGSAPLVPPSSDVEMVELVETLNDLLRRVTKASERKSRFYAVLSHELRTPLQALTGHLELAVSRPRSTEEYQALFSEVQDQARRLSSLVEGVLLLHRLDLGVEAPFETVSVDMAIDRWREEEPRIDWKERQTLTVRCVSAHLEILLSNLISNALRHGAPGGKVEIVLCEGKLRIANALEDPALDVASLNEPFIPRVSRAGNGLGIPIVQTICQTNGWNLTYQKVGGQVSAQVEFNPA